MIRMECLDRESGDESLHSKAGGVKPPLQERNQEAKARRERAREAGMVAAEERAGGRKKPMAMERCFPVQPRSAVMASCMTVAKMAKADCVRPMTCLGTMAIRED